MICTDSVKYGGCCLVSELFMLLPWIVADYFSLVDTETHFDYFNPQLTGIDADKVKGAPNFAEL